MVPLNLGTEIPLSLKPHFLHSVASLSFWVPQLGQNTDAPPLVIVALIAATYQNNSWSAVLPGGQGSVWLSERAGLSRPESCSSVGSASGLGRSATSSRP
jgi:hypothetical protein